jgi:hypothetical protein
VLRDAPGEGQHARLDHDGDFMCAMHVHRFPVARARGAAVVFELRSGRGRRSRAPERSRQGCPTTTLLALGTAVQCSPDNVQS